MAETLISSKKNALSSPYKLYYKTTTMCPECQTFIPGDVVQKHDSIYIDRTCPTHGFFEGIICSDVEWYEKLHKFDVEPVKPLYSHSNSTDGCPQDCGLCKAHRQIAGTAAIEITNYCNAKCPTCLSDNKNSFNLAVNEVKTMVDNLFKSQNYVDVIVLSGGEPTIHPELFSILDYIKNVNVGRVVINSNGLRISKDNEFLDRLAKYDNIYICLHFDGNNSKKLRGIEKEIQEKALERLCEWGINVTPLILASKGINDDELGILVTELLKRSRFVKSVMISMMSYNGFNGTQFPGDKLTRLTIPSTLDCVERSSEGVLKKSDFIPLPMPNPLCSAIGYFLIEDDEITPLIPLVDIDRAINYITNSNFARIDKELEVFFKDIINNIYVNSSVYENSNILLRKFKNILNRIFPKDNKLNDVERQKIVEESLKTVYLFQLMDSWTFDSKRLSKCSCQHLLPDNKIIPSCHYYSYSRRLDKRFTNI